MIDEIVSTTVRDGTEIAARIYRPDGSGPCPALFGASPYRFDNNRLPASPQFLWRETGPIEWYVEQGYAYVHMDVRGSGRSGGDFEFMGKNEQTDLYDVIEWIGAQAWCSGKVGGIGQSYFCMLQWFMGALAPPALACLAAHDGLNDPYRAGTHQGGIPAISSPAIGGTRTASSTASRPTARRASRRPISTRSWPRIRPSTRSGANAAPGSGCRRSRCRSIRSASGARSNCIRAAISTAICAPRGPKKLRMSGAPNAWAAAAEFSSVDFHKRVLLPFYEHYLKGKSTDYTARPNVEYAVRGTNITRSAETWPPAGTKYKRWFLNGTQTGSVTSLNDGGLAPQAANGAASTSYQYPNPGWVAGVAGFGPTGPAGGFDPVRRVLTFTSAPLGKDMEICGPIKLVLYASSSARDTDFFIKLSDQFPQSPEERGKGLNPFVDLITRGWLRASHRALDAERSTDMVPYQTHSNPQPLNPGEIYKFEISLEPMAYLIQAGHRLRLEIVNGDSPASEQLRVHYYRPDKIGTDTVFHDAAHPSELVLPTSPQAN